MTIALVWTIVHAAGLIAAAYDLLEAWRDWKAFKRHGIDGARTFVAIDSIRRELFRFFTLLFLTLAGLVAVLRLPHLRPITVYLLLFAGVLLASAAVFDLFARRKLMGLLRN
jgi:hypothetical protein